MTSPIVMDAVERHPMIIGEAASRLPDEVTRQCPDVPWHQMRGMRNRLVHAYRGTDPVVLWKASKVDLPFPVRQLRDAFPDVE